MKQKRILPYNIVAEKSVLSILINYPTAIEKIALVLSEESFYLDENRIIYQTLLRLNTNKRPITLTTIISELQDKNLLKFIGGLKEIINLSKNLDSLKNLKDYLNLLNEKLIRRKLIKLGEILIEKGFLTSEPLDDIFEKAEEEIFQISQQKSVENISNSAEILLDTLEELQQKSKKEEINGFASSYKELDTILQGFQKKDVIVIAGRPSMGKTAFALNIARNIVLKYNLPIIFFSLEMSKQQLMYRLLSMESTVSGTKLRRGQMKKEEWLKIKNASEKLCNLPIYIEDNPSISLTEIKSKIRKVILIHKQVSFVLIDYLQLMKLHIKLQNRVQEISHITRNLKSIAKEFDLPLVLLSQLSRNVESRINKKPVLSDLRESGCLPLKKSEICKNCWSGFFIQEISSKKNYVFKGIKPIFKISDSLQLTGNHKILYKFGWVKLREIRKINRLNKNHINYSGIEKVYDIEISLYHNFFKNNILLHNSIEQDADIVLMLYREDYYKPFTLKNSGKSITEIIIAKHRNGPVGSARLIFDTNLTRFYDM